MNISDLHAMRLLIVDDKIENVNILEDMLTGEGFRNVVSTTDPRRTLDLVSAFDPDLVLLDLMMPDLDGYAVLEQLARRTPPNEFRPVMVISADVTQEARRRALSLGAKDFLTKPFDLIETMLRICNLLETSLLYKRLQALTSPEPPLQRWHPKSDD
ncbi:two-component system response regulator [Massilia violaceinigra]|uniref:Two-component system response regulator n=1 Tax=Massilia violaceinigra TaxID=2045208 RepID=A0A2D2DTG4_9BURK|nr:response regulator [Massilia violaceinigra]ATQ78257.1 two-component system response regulator [Massilia violaceinigra]